MLEKTETKIIRLEDKTLNEIMQKLQAGQQTTQEEKEQLWKGLLKKQG